jgi:hypothetical protein
MKGEFENEYPNTFSCASFHNSDHHPLRADTLQSNTISHHLGVVYV